MKSAFVLLLAGLPFAALAQGPGELTGARPSGDLLAQPHTATHRATASSDPVQQHLLQTEIDLAQARAEQLPDLYERFMVTTREERRSWTYPQWDAAGQVLARLNQRYGQVHSDLPIEERLRIRSFRGEFHTLRGARKVKDKLD